MSTPAMPDEVEIMKMVNTRRREIMTLQNEVQMKLPKLAVQRLPRVMRRRAASNNPSRIPKSCRGKWAKDFLNPKSKTKDKKRQQKKKHVNPKQRQKSIDRRKAKDDRTLLHVWFAKRFKMDNNNGVVVPVANTSKNQRPLFRKAISHCVYYYMSPFLRCITVNAGVHQFVDALVKELPEIKLLCDNQRIKLSDVRCDAQNTLGPVEIIKVSDKLIQVWIHHTSANAAIDYLNLSSGLIDCEVALSDLERVRLVGPEAAIKIKSYLNFDLPTDFNIHFENDLLFIRDSIGSRSTIDIVIPKTKTKMVWSQLVRNRGHLVGGLRNLKMLHFNASCTFYPDFGYPEISLPSKQSKFSWEKIMCHDGHLEVVRGLTLGQLIEHQMKSDLSSLSKCIRENIRGNQLIPVKITGTEKGCPISGSLICIPNDGNLNIQYPLDDCLSSCPFPVIGFVEFGEYCMTEGSGKGIGCVSSNGLLGIIDRHVFGGSNFIECLFINPHCVKFRRARITIIS